jgi:O-methyltransferase
MDKVTDDFKFAGKTLNQVNYVLNTGNRISELKDKLIEETILMFPANKSMTTQQTEAEFLKMQVKLTNCKKGIEIGTFTGYSALCMAEGLPDDGELFCFDNWKEVTDVAEKYWKLAKVENKIKLHLGNGVEKIDEVLLSKKENLESFDFAYIDADKPNYMNYYEQILKLLKPNGWIVIDNVLWQYKVVDDVCQEESTNCFRKLNTFLRNDDRVDINMLDISDGITIVRKK